MRWLQLCLLLVLLPLAPIALTGVLGLAFWYPIDRQQKRKAEQASS